MEIKPFFINSCFINSVNDVINYDTTMKACAYNTGNMYITYSLIKQFCTTPFKASDAINNIHIYDFKNVDYIADKINNEYSHCFFILQDEIRIKDFGLNYESCEVLLNKIKKPIFVAGLGANTLGDYDASFHKKLKPEMVRFLKVLSEKTNQIGVRGYYTQEVLHKLGIDNVNVIGCPSYYEMGKDRIVKKYSNLNLSEILLSSKLNNRYVKDNIQVCQDMQEEKQIKAILYKSLEYPIDCDILNKILQDKYVFFTDISSWKNFVAKFKLVVGRRVHGSILSMNSGNLAICGNTDSRATEMCEYLGIPQTKRLKTDYDFDILEYYYSIDEDKINKKYIQVYENYENFVKTNGLVLNDNLNRDFEIGVKTRLNSYKNEEDYVKSLYIVNNSIVQNSEYQISNIKYQISNIKYQICNPLMSVRVNYAK